MHQLFFSRTLFVVILSMIGTGLLFSSSVNAATQTAEERQAEKDADNTALIVEELSKLQTFLEEDEGGNGAVKAAKDALRYYARLSDAAQATAEVTAYKSQIDELTIRADEQVEAEKLAKSDARSLTTSIVGMDKVDGYLSSNSVASARRSLDSATRSFDKISDISLQNGEFQTAQARLNDLISAVEAAEGQAADQRQTANNVVFSASSFITYVPENAIIALLARGAGETDLDQPMHSRQLKEAYDATNFPALQADFIQRYSLLVQTQGNLAQSNGLTPNNILELMNNKEAYRDSFVTQNGVNHFNWKIDILDEADQRLKDDDYLIATPGLLPELYGPDADAPFNEVTEMKKYYDWIGQTLPASEIATLAEYKNTLRESLSGAAERNEWDSSAYPYTNELINERAQTLCADDAVLVKAGVTGENDWRINKNVLDIPMSRSVFGYILCQHPNEPFKRGYNVGFAGEFNGVGYEPIFESARLDTVMSPHN